MFYANIISTLLHFISKYRKVFEVMKIKLAILEKDQSYLNRISSVFNTKYSDKFQVYSFTDMETAFSVLDSSRIEVLVASDYFNIDFARLPQRCGFAYLVETSGIETFNDKVAICKFQKADLIYKQILSVYSENAGNISGIKFGEDDSKVVVFTTPSGGAGASCMAAACSIYFASQGKRVLYLNLERFGYADLFFDAEGQFDMSDIIFALKSKKTNLQLKIESCIKQSIQGVSFFSQTKIAPDMLEMTIEEKIRLISELRLLNSYDYIIVDYDFDLTKEALQLYIESNSIVWVGDGSEISNIKISRAYNAMVTVEQSLESSISNRVLLIYNKFSNKTGKSVGDIGIKSIGGAPRYEHANTQQVVTQLSKFGDIFEKIV